MNNKNFKVCVLITCLMASYSLSPISDKWVIPGTVTSAFGGGTAAYYLTRNSSDLTKIISILASTAGVGALANWLLCRFTPQGRYDRAMKTLVAVKEDGFLALELAGADESTDLKKYCRAEYENDWYLKEAKMRLNKLKNDLVWAWTTLGRAQQEANYSLGQQCHDAKQQTEILRAKVVHLLDLDVFDSEEYYLQCKLYDAYLERLQQEQMHREDRYDCWDDRSDRRRDKRLDRELKKELHREKIDAKKGITSSSQDKEKKKSASQASSMDWEEVMMNVDFM